MVTTEIKRGKTAVSRPVFRSNVHDTTISRNLSMPLSISHWNKAE